MDARVGHFEGPSSVERRRTVEAKPRHALATLVLAVAAPLWAGMLIGVSGMATPIKFTASSLSLPVALEIGNVTFHLLNRVELGCAVVLALVAAAARPPRWSVLCIGIVMALVAAQAFWLLPALDVRVAIVIAGAMPPPSSLHLWYIGVEIAKLLALLGLGIGVLRHGQKTLRRSAAGNPEASMTQEV